MEAAAQRVRFRTASRLLSFLVLTSVACATLGSGEEVSTTDKVAWLASNAVALRSFDPHDADYSDLQPLRKAIGDSRVVALLGPLQSHEIMARYRIVRFLHEEMGFDVLASDMVTLFDAEEFDRPLDHGKTPSAEIAFTNAREFGVGGFGIWRYVQASHKTKRPLHLAGVRGSISRFMLAEYSKKLARFLGRLDPALASPADRKAIQALLARNMTAPHVEMHFEGRGGVVHSTPQPWAAEINPGLIAIANLYEGLGKLPAAGHDVSEIMFYRQTLSNIAYATASHAGIVVPTKFRPGAEEQLARMWHPSSKIIMWSSNMLGRVALSRDAYAIAFDEIKTDNGVLETLQAGSDPKLGPVDGDLESLLHAARKPVSFVEFRSLPKDHWLRTPLSARFFGSPGTYVWPNHYDGLVTVDIANSKEHKQ